MPLVEKTSWHIRSNRAQIMNGICFAKNDTTRVFQSKMLKPVECSPLISKEMALDTAAYRPAVKSNWEFV